MKVRTATGLLAWYMRRCDFRGWASFWNTIYVLPGFEHDQRLLRHERTHLEQIERDGRLLFTIKYSWWTLRYGYYMNPLRSRGPCGRKQVTMTPEERKALISEIVEVMNSTKPQLSDEEMQWVRLAIEAESRKIRFRDAVIEKLLGA